MEIETKLSKGDWIVHASYGLGQVQGEETKVLEGKESDYYIVQTDAATYWLPKNRIDVQTIREVSPLKNFQQALSVIEEKPEIMDQDFRKRRTRIVDAIASNTLNELAGLIRDLYWRRRRKTLNENEKHALDLLKRRFAREWSVAGDMKEQETLALLENTLSASVDKFGGLDDD